MFNINKRLMPSQDARVRAKQVRLLMEQTTQGVIGAVPGVALLAWILYPDNPPVVLALWVMSIVSFLSFRLYWNYQQLQKTLTDEDIHQLTMPLLLQTGLSGALWASVIFMMPLEFHSQLMVLGMACVLGVGSAISLSSYLPAYITIVVPALLSQCIWFLWQGTALHTVAGLSVLLLTVILTVMTAKLQQSTVKNFELALKNEELLSRLVSFKDALEHAAEPITIFNANTGKLKYANPAFSYLTGFKQDELMDIHWDELYVDLYTARKLFNQDGCTLSGLPWSGELVVKTISEDLPIACGFSPVRSATGEVKELVNIQRDVREDKVVQQRLEKLNRMEALSLMAASVAHDFNNILTAIVGNAQLAEMQSQHNPKALTSLERIVRSTTRATGLCKQMLAYSGKGSFVVAALQLDVIVKDMYKTLDKTTGHRYSLNVNVADDCPSMEGDDVQVRQLIMNISLNASEALAEQEAGDISYDVRPKHYTSHQLKVMHAGDQGLEEGEYIQLSIRDNGEGMSSKTLERVYEPFFSTRFVGRGLGLSAVHGIVRGHKGGMNIVSEAGEGTTVVVIFPALKQ